MAVIDFPNPTPAVASVPQSPRGARPITPNDVDTFSVPVHVYVGGAGTVSVLPANGEPATDFVGLAAGQMVPVMVVGVRATGTTATNLRAVY